MTKQIEFKENVAVLHCELDYVDVQVYVDLDGNPFWFAFINL